MYWIRSKMQLNVLTPSCANVYTYTCAHTPCLVGGSDVRWGWKKLLPDVFPASLGTLCGWQGCAVNDLVGHFQVWHFLSKVSSWEASFLSDLFACHNSKEKRLGVEAVLPCADAEECRASDPNMLCTVPCSIYSFTVMSFVLYVDIDEFLENISHHKNGSQSIWLSPLVRESSEIIMLSEISLSLWMCVEFNEPFYLTCSPSTGKDGLQRDVWTLSEGNLISVFRDLIYSFIFSCNV